MIPVRKVMEEICPSPVARKLRIKRRAPEGRSDWSGCGTMDGLNSAADSKEYSDRKSYGRNMSLPRGAQAEDKTQSAGRQVRLVRVRHDGRVEQCSRFQGVFRSEKLWKKYVPPPWRAS